MKHPLVTRLISVGLSAVLLVSAAGASLIDGGFTYSYRIGSGTDVYKRQGRNRSARRRLEAPFFPVLLPGSEGRRLSCLLYTSYITTVKSML